MRGYMPGLPSHAGIHAGIHARSSGAEAGAPTSRDVSTRRQATSSAPPTPEGKPLLNPRNYHELLGFPEILLGFLLGNL